MKFKKFTFYLFLIIIPMLMTCQPLPADESDTAPKVIGVTDGSVYTRNSSVSSEYIKPWWFDNATGTLSKDGGTPTACTNRETLIADGEYLLTLVNSANSESIVVKFTIDSTADSGRLYTNTNKVGTGLEIVFNQGAYYQTYRPNMVIWVEDLEGNFLHNLYVSHMPATSYARYTNSYKTNYDGLPYWRYKTCAGSPDGYPAPETPVPFDLDAVTGATQYQAFNLSTKVRTREFTADAVRIFLEINQAYDKYTSGFFGSAEEPAIIYSVTVDLTEPGVYVLGKYNAPVSSGEIMPEGYFGYYLNNTLNTEFYHDNESKFHYAHKMVGSIDIIVPCGKNFDPDGDGICNNSTACGTTGDNPCTGGNTSSCDDNCPDTCNFEQLDADNDSIGDVCDPQPGCGGCGQTTCEQPC